ncbi:hypothetical protein BDN71DRAFT_1454452 [Pleurotus eryngii]|uniref:Uncharacterized protein n=1 Tax=Pleurotus eryngii TaxID=5323 RepID=A0A9P5ZPH0_PLEER|nr:hypothetical protein BDN71DRAFT_1454452 [Pleurotus eryngii]
MISSILAFVFSLLAWALVINEAIEFCENPNDREGFRKLCQAFPMMKRIADAPVWDLVAQHPKLTLAVGVLVCFQPLILRPFLRLIGFGELGPTKGSVAARAQSKLYGPNTPKGGIFSHMERTGMKSYDRR